MPLLKAQKPLVLVENGKSKYRIVVCGPVGGTESRAASILQTGIKKMTGVEIPVINDDGKVGAFDIRIGNTGNNFQGLESVLPLLKEDGFWIKSNKNQLLIYGGTRKGVIYGVTSLLEDVFGYRKLTADAEFVPSYTRLVMNPVNKMEVPRASMRIVHGPIADDEAYRDFRKLSLQEDFWCDGDWKGYYVHTFSRLVPKDVYYASHPEYFSWVNGKRIPHGQLCLSNPEVLKIVIAKLREEMAAHPDIQYWSVSQNDTYDQCQCERCRAIDEEEGSSSGSLLRFVNEVARAFPEKTITTLAYQYSRKPPRITKPEKNVMITLCTIELNRSMPIETDPSSASFVEDIKGWSKITNNIMLWDYEVQFTNYLCPFPLFRTLQPNLQFFTRYHVNAHFQQCNAAPGNEFSDLKAYYLSKILWNPDANGDSIINDFMLHYYQEAAPFIRTYFDLLHDECQKSNVHLDIYGSPVHYGTTFLSAALIRQYNQLFDQAGAAVAGKPEVLERVKLARLPIQFAIMEIGKSDLFGERGWYREVNGKYEVKPEMTQLLEDFYSCCQRNHISDINENGLTAAMYYQSTLRFIDVQVEGNLAFKKPVTCEPAPDPRYLCAGPATLTNGVKGTDDYTINWLGWEGRDVTIILDLTKIEPVNSVTLGSLQYPKSWIILPVNVACSLSHDGVNYSSRSIVTTDPLARTDRETHDFSWTFPAVDARYIKFEITGTKTLPAWHNYAGNKSWVFLDEIVVR